MKEGGKLGAEIGGGGFGILIWNLYQVFTMFWIINNENEKEEIDIYVEETLFFNLKVWDLKKNI